MRSTEYRSSYLFIYLFITSAEEIVCLSALVYLFFDKITPKLLHRFSQNSVEKVAHENPLEVGGNHLT